MVEYSPEKEEIIGYPKRIWSGGTDRGCIEAPHLTQRGDYYYIMCAEGGTGYNHCVTMGRSKDVWGPYEKDPMNPIVTSAPAESYERHDPDHLKPKYYNPDSILQKSGHGSYVDLPTGQVYLVHLSSRPFAPELRCTLGRETSIQKMMWTENDMVIISTAMVLGLGIQEMLMHFTRGISSFEMPWYIPLTIPFSAFLCAIPSALINDCDGLNKTQIGFRIFLHFICLMIVVTICGYVFGWYSQGTEYMVIMLVYFIIYVSVWLISWWLGKRDEEIINQALKNIHDKE